MLSRISIDVDGDNQPIIKIEYKPSDDVRDKLVKKFMETFGSQSTFATFFFYNTPIDQGNTTAIVRPLPVRDFQYHVNDMIRMNEAYQKELQPIPKTEDYGKP